MTEPATAASAPAAATIRAGSAAAAALLRAAADGDGAALRAADPRALRRARCASGCAALHYAAGQDRLAVLDYLLLELPAAPPSDEDPEEGAGEKVSVSAAADDTNDNAWGPDLRVAATGRARGRVPLHYAARNGCLQAARYLVVRHKADPDARTHHGVSPLQLAVWRNHLPVARFLVQECGVDARQTNAFGCGLVHWLASCPRACMAHPETQADLIATAEWLARLPGDGLDFAATQRQGHGALHKAAWAGHGELCRHLHERHGLWDAAPDRAGNFAADVADMAGHAAVARYLRAHCSGQRAAACRALGLSLQDADDPRLVRRAYRVAARGCHPDRVGIRRQDGTDEDTDSPEREFHLVAKAYHHLTQDHGRGDQRNPAHSLPLMLQLQRELESESNDDGTRDRGSGRGALRDDDGRFAARLTAVLLEYGAQGLDLSNLRKKWRQVWPDAPFPRPPLDKPMALSDLIARYAGAAVALRADERGCLRAYARVGPAAGHGKLDTIA